MFFTYGTDAPIYFWPVTTVLMIVASVVVLVLEFTYPENVLPFILVWGHGLHPLQWLTSNFMHAGWMHLIGNMFCLWSFGLVVEGKIGWYKTLAVGLGIGVVQAAIQQIVMLGASSGGSLGASVIIYGFMAMSLVWAPENNMQCVLVIWLRPIEFELKMTSFVGVMLAIQIFWAIVAGGVVTSAALHLLGAVLGAGIAIGMLKAKVVDCENWDIFSVAAGRHRMTRMELLKAEAASPENVRRKEEMQQAARTAALAQIRELTVTGRPVMALARHKLAARDLPDWSLPEEDLVALVKAFHRDKLWIESMPVMAEHLLRRPHDSIPLRLKLAQVLVVEAHRPAQALKVLNKLDPATLDRSQMEFLRKLRAKAEQVHEQDPFEIADEDW